MKRCINLCVYSFNLCAYIVNDPSLNAYYNFLNLGLPLKKND